MSKLIFIITLLFGSMSFGFTPKSINDFYNTSVRVYNSEMNSGGTGSIFRSFSNASHILTNKHVCRLIEPGGNVSYKGKVYPITHYKKFKDHDLCLVRVETGFGINLEVSDNLMRRSKKVYVSGHPNLLPHIVTKGHTTDNINVKLVIGLKECTTEDILEDPVSCGWFGGKPIVESFDSQVVSNLIKPGSSGSAVFNGNGRLIGVAFAGNGRGFSHGFIVPHLYLLYFTQNAHRFKWVKVGTPVDDKGIRRRIFNFEKCKSPMLELKRFKKVKKFCRTVKDNVIGRL